MSAAAVAEAAVGTAEAAVGSAAAPAAAVAEAAVGSAAGVVEEPAARQQLSGGDDPPCDQPPERCRAARWPGRNTLGEVRPFMLAQVHDQLDKESVHTSAQNNCVARD